MDEIPTSYMKAYKIVGKTLSWSITQDNRGMYYLLRAYLPGKDRWKERSTTLPGIAAAMADQWGEYVARQLAA